MELEELCHEKKMQREEIQKLMGQIHRLKSELQDMEAQEVLEAESREQLEDLQDRTAAQKSSKQELETESDHLQQEFHYREDNLVLNKEHICKAE
ncbi:Golgin subfamily A member 5 [Fukomys damarensis]|uniref:Golgin subfamily A member 5 n=1 Tax=Fukomys damarensis TaxID=885580 RepID=A0A091CQL0_FUKDA|nr:Golgin subfamily A member 5 [Fukomys damarensis]